MNLKLKPIQDQVIIITGASSGVGLATARMAVARGARVVLASRNQEELNRICNDLNREYGKGRAVAVWVAADVAAADQVQSIADSAIRNFGGFDTWVNNAAVSIYGRLREIPLVEKRRLFDVNFWGVVHGCRSALPHLSQHGGAIINIGSVVSDRSLPIQGIYSATKQAVKAYTDALRMECEADALPVSVTLIKPASIDTPYTEHARNHMKREPTYVAPVYAAEVVAEAILACAQTPRRDLFVGGSAKAFSLMEHFTPRLADKVMERTMIKGQQKRQARRTHEDSLFTHPRREGQTAGNYKGHVARSSYFTSATLHPLRTAAFMITALGAMSLLLSRKRRPLDLTRQTSPSFFMPGESDEARTQLH
ncbi:MAG: SDR family oxidoreductase [Bdellovibrionaceae bacterium]|nr:SDR family oxidoreductase [Pseudobdellovibrionaceae bacterium]